LSTGYIQSRIRLSSRWDTSRRRRRRRIDDAVVISHEVAGIAISRRPGAFRQHGVVPGLPIAFEAIEDLFLPVLEIGPLARILDDIEEKFVAGNAQIFPIAVANRALRSGLITPVEFARMRRGAASHDRP